MPWEYVTKNTLPNLTNNDVDIIFRGDSPIPRFFMTGDGHRQPPFLWTTECIRIRDHFEALVENGSLFAHVEQHPSDVGINSVPNYMHPLLNQGRVCGWELAIYKDLEPLMNSCRDLIAQLHMDLAIAIIYQRVLEIDRDMVRLLGLLWQIGNPPALRNAAINSAAYRHYFQRVSKSQITRNLAIEADYSRFLLRYYNDAMALRTVVNPYIGRNIQRIINQYPNATHLITCGWTHITDNPLPHYVALPEGAHGIVDASSGVEQGV